MFGYISYNIKVLKAQQECLSYLFLKVFLEALFIYILRTWTFMLTVTNVISQISLDSSFNNKQSIVFRLQYNGTSSCIKYFDNER